MLMSAFVTPFWIAFGVSAVAAWPIYRLLLAMKSRQVIDPHAPPDHQRKQGTPTMGGLIILAGLVATLFFPEMRLTPLVLLVGYALIGFADDFIVPKLMAGKRGLGWKQKLVLQALIGIGAFATDPSALYNPAVWGFGVFLALFFANAYNFADGLDGLAGSILVAYCVGMVGVGLWLSSPGPVLGVSAALIGATLPFLFLNSAPAKIFMGDIGALPIGAVIGYLNFKWFTDPAAFHVSDILTEPLAILALNTVLILELVLVPIQVAYFKKTKKRIFPATPIHHGFEVKGVPETKVVAWFALTQLILGVLAISILWLSRPVVHGATPVAPKVNWQP